MYINLNYVRPGKNLKNQVMRSLGYIANRPGKDKEQLERILFGHGGPLTKEQVDRMIDEAPKNTYFWRLKVSPDLEEENSGRNLDLWELTRRIVEFLEERLDRLNIPFVGAEHNNTHVPHVHAILLIQRRGREIIIDQNTIDAVHTFAAEQALKQQLGRHQTRPLEPVRSAGQERRHQPLTGTLGGQAKRERGGAPRPAYIGPSCPKCPGTQAMWKDEAGNRYCPECGFRYVQRSKSYGLEASR